MLFIDLKVLLQQKNDLLGQILKNCEKNKLQKEKFLFAVQYKTMFSTKFLFKKSSKIKSKIQIQKT